MQIDRIYYPVKTLGYGNRIGIWTIGCSHHCKNCSNPELWEKDSSRDISIERIIECVQQVHDADGITITGGEPFDQPDELELLVHRLKDLGYRDILVYSGYTLEELQAKSETVRRILNRIGILIDGRYLDELNDNMSFRGSSNQRILRLNETLIGRYKNAETWNRESQIIMSDNKIQTIGLPLKENNQKNR